MKKTKLGIALGSGSARGWSHIGVLRALAERGLRPDVVCGASVGSLVGAAFASDQLDTLEDWVRSLTRIDVMRLLDAGFRGGVIQGSRVMNAIGAELVDADIESLETQFGAVATDLATGREVWIRTGPMLTAVRASSGLPGLFPPIRNQDRWLVDGGVVNPVPISMCLALGADVVIAVNLNRNIVQHRRPKRQDNASRDDDSDVESSRLERLAAVIGDWLPGHLNLEDSNAPGILDVVGGSINIMQERITRSRMAGEPPDVLLAPGLADFQLMDFHRADEAIKAGRDCVAAAAEQLEQLAEAAD